VTPPLIKGGQGRTSQSIRHDASSLAFTGLALLALVLAVFLKGR
jgi:hypothetical protein